ncbi:MAG: VanW family protein [Anaerolineales bacterium]
MMDTTQTFVRRGANPRKTLQWALLAFAAGTAAILIGFLLFILGVRLFTIGEALPGVRAGGLDVSGMSRQEIELALGDELTYAQTGLVVLRDGNRQWLAQPADLGVVVDVPAMANQALAIGRQGSLLHRVEQQLIAWNEGARIPPIVLFDQRAGSQYLRQLANEINRPTVEAQLQVNGTQVVATPGQTGRQLDIAATLESLTPPVSRMVDAQVELVVAETPPVVSDASQDATRATALLSAPLQLTTETEVPLSLNPEQVAAMLRFEPIAEQARYAIRLDSALLQSVLEPLAPDLAHSPRNARFIFNDDTLQLDLLEPAVIGRQLNVADSIAAINQGVEAGQHQVGLAFDTSDPAVTSDATAEELGITENVVATSTYFSGSSAGRIQNIKTASSAFHGLLIAPGETLSMADILGDISLDTGYAEALIIYGDRTIKGVGGGVCQVSTTLFRAAFYGGFQIDERNPHAYRVMYYEQGPNSPGPGLDATVFVPLVDFKFTNDSEYWLLSETYVYGTQLLWKFYSTSDSRTVNWSSSGPKNVIDAPKPLYKENEDLDKGEIEKVDYEADGMDVVVTRTVKRDGQVIHDDVIRTHYLPWRAIYEYGPGTELPKDAKTE